MAPHNTRRRWPSWRRRRVGTAFSNRKLQSERLELRLVLDSSLIISEFMANNDSTLADDDGDYSDWIEVHNAGDMDADLGGWYLTDDAGNLTNWQFPSLPLPAGGYLTVFASAKDRTNPAAPLHSDFQLDAEGEYLALVQPDGTTVAHEYGSSYPPQLPDVSYGVHTPLTTTLLVNEETRARLLAPLEPADLAAGWNDVGFDDSSWSGMANGAEGLLPAGYDTNDAGEIPTSGLQLWLRADQGVVTVDNSGAGGTVADVVRWEDQSGLNHDAVQSDVSRQPALIEDGLNGQPILRFEQDYFNDVIVNSVGNQFSFFAVLNPLALNAYHNVFERSTAERPMLWVRNTNEYEFNFSEPTGLQVGQIDSSWDIAGGVVRDSGTRQSFYLNEPAATEANNASFTVPAGNSAYRLFNRNGGQIYEGDFAELIIYNDALTDTEVAQVGGYLQEKYGIDGTFTPPSIDSLFQTDVQTQMFQQASSLLVRQSFEATDPTSLDRLELEVRYDDGFVAYLNGQEVARRNAFGAPGTPQSFNSTAAGFHAPELTEIIDISEFADLLQAGTNVLALQGLNFVSADSDFILGATLTGFDATSQPESIQTRYFLTATPEGLNGTDENDQGPVISEIAHSPQQPADQQDLVVTARVQDPEVDSVTLHFRVMYAPPIDVPMVDDGSGVDPLANDGVFSAAIPANAYSAGQLVRYYVTAENPARSSRWPLFPLQRESDEYLGTVVSDPTVDSLLPVLHWYTDAPAAADSESRVGARASLFYDGELYDNVFVRVRGASSAAAAKKPYKFDFNPGHFFHYSDDRPRVEEVNLNTTFQDKAYLRAQLAHEVVADMGTPSSDAFNMRVQRNGDFFSVATFTEQVDEIFLQRNNLDPSGALYKMFNGITSASAGVEKKTRLDEDQSDLQQLVAGLSTSNADRSEYIFDHIDIPAALNYATSGIIIQDFDRGAKNFYVYRDSNNSGEWTQIPWDFDLTFGNRFYSDEISGNGSRGHGVRSHPYWGESEHNLFGTNMMIDALVDDPVTREMYLRRLRTLMDEHLQPPETPQEELRFERRIDELAALLTDDAALDLAEWGAIYGIVRDFPTAIDLLKNNYLAERRTHLYVTHTVTDAEPVTTIISGTPGATTARIMVPTNDSLGISWTQADFILNANWSEGTTGIGYETAPGDYQNLLTTSVRPQDECQECTSVFVRVPFTLDELTPDDRLTLRMKYDDGFVAYINGQEVARANVNATPVGTPPAYDDLSLLHDDAAAIQFEDFDISSFVDLLNVGGDNVLAIHGLNRDLTSSDMLILPELVIGVPATTDGVGIPDAQPDFAAMPVDQRGLEFGTIEFAPASGNQDEEYLQIVNNNDIAVDISGWKLRDGVRLTFAPGTVIPSHSTLYVSPNVAAFRARVSGPSGGQSLFVQGNYGGHLSSLGETLTLLDTAGGQIASVTYAGDPTALQQHLRITELNYNPYSPSADELAALPEVANDDFEFIEFINTGPDALELAGVAVTSGIQFTFGNSSLEPGQRGVLVRNTAAFIERYGGDILLLGEFASGSLSNGGETVKVEDPASNTIQEFSYNDSGDWPELADGRGTSLEVIDPGGDYDSPANWRSSREFFGTPGSTGSGPVASIVINEVLTHTDLPLVDSIELYNISDAQIDLSGWLLSDTSTHYLKYSFPANTMLAPGAYLTIDEGDFNASMGVDPDDFALDGAHGDNLYLLETSITGEWSAIVDYAEFDAEANGESWGRWPNGSGNLYPMATNTLNGENSGPRIGPVIISELMYHPSVSPGSGIDPDDLEFVEIYNPTGQATALTDWQLTGGIDFAFPATARLEAQQLLVVLPFDPLLAENSGLLQQFRTHYGIDETAAVVGGYSGKLSNTGEHVRLSRPDEPPLDEPQFIPLLLEDEASYDSVVPWPATPDGQGDSLTRIVPAGWGHDAVSWFANPPSPGRLGTDRPPRVSEIKMQRDVANPVDLPAGAQPVDWARQRSELVAISIIFSESVSMTAADIVLTNVGLDAPATPDVVVPIQNQQVQVEANVATISFGIGVLDEGVYQLEVLSSVIDSTGNQLDGNDDGTPGDRYFIAGTQDNGLFKLVGDWNGDAGVSIFDFPTFAYWFGQEVSVAPEYVDLNGDGGISIFDFPLFAANFGQGVTFPVGFSTTVRSTTVRSTGDVSMRAASQDDVRSPTPSGLPPFSIQQRSRAASRAVDTLPAQRIAKPNSPPLSSQSVFAVTKRRSNSQATLGNNSHVDWEDILEAIGDDVFRGWHTSD